MRTTRITYEGAWHHIMGRGLTGKDIFFMNKSKLVLLDLLKAKSASLKVRVVAYCINDNDYHLILENTGGRMSDFLKSVNGEYGIYYRKLTGSEGNVFYDRYKSVLIQDESRLKMAIAHVLLTPVHAGFVEKIDDYLWSSAPAYFSAKNSEYVDNRFVDELFENKRQFRQYLRSRVGEKLPVFRTIHGYILGERSFLKEALKKYQPIKNFHKTRKKKAMPVKHVEPVEKVIAEFEKNNDVKIDEIDTSRFKGKRLRGRLLLELKNRAGLRYKEMMKFPIFSNLKPTSLGKLYQDAKKKMKAK